MEEFRHWIPRLTSKWALMCATKALVHSHKGFSKHITLTLTWYRCWGCPSVTSGRPRPPSEGERRRKFLVSYDDETSGRRPGTERWSSGTWTRADGWWWSLVLLLGNHLPVRCRRSVRRSSGGVGRVCGYNDNSWTAGYSYRKVGYINTIIFYCFLNKFGMD